MKRIIALMIVVVVAGGCATKDEKARTNIAQVWRISKVLENGADVTTAYTDSRITYRISFSNSGAFLERYYPFSGADEVSVSGTWFFSDGIRKVSLDDNNQARVYQIDLLEEDNFNITDLGSNNGRQIEFVPE